MNKYFYYIYKIQNLDFIQKILEQYDIKEAKRY